MRRVRICIVAGAVIVGAAAAAHAQPERPAREGPTYRVLIDSVPRGATVYLDGREYGDVGKTPYTARLQAGSWKVILDLDGHASSVTTLDVKRQRRRQVVKLELKEVSSGIVAVTAPEGDVAHGAEVLIDGMSVGWVPDEFEIEIGPHQVVVQPDEGEPYEEWIQLEQGQRVTVEPELGQALVADAEVGDFGDFGDDDGGGAPVERARHPRAPSRDSGDLRSALLVLESGIHAAGRHFSFSGAQPGPLRRYDIDAVPMFHLAVELYPLSGYDNPAFRALGVTASFDYALSITSSTSDGAEVDTSWTQAETALRLRVPVGDAGLIAASVGYGATAFSFDVQGSLAAEVPAVDYRYLRYALEARATMGDLGLFAGGSYLQVASAGDVAERFDDAAAVGVGGKLGAAYRLGPNVEARVTGRYHKFTQEFSATPDDTYIADGAVDHLYGVMLGGAYIY